MPIAPTTAPLPAWSRAPQGRLDWFLAQRLGLFLHWGPVALIGQEISWSRGGPRPLDIQDGPGRIPFREYDQLWQRFNPDGFDAKAWVALAQAAGMRYLVFTSKHHDGFSMYDTKLSSYRITNTPFGRDPLRELSDACHAAGLGFGIYYSQRDWWHAQYGTPDHQHYVDHMHGQLRELLTDYGQVDILWFDSIGGDPSWWRGDDLFRLVRELQPGCLVNDRAMAVLADYRGAAARWQGDFQTPEQRIGTFQREPCWESCMTLCGHRWSFAPELQPHGLDRCLEWVWQTAGGDGNLLLNVGPDAQGLIPTPEAERLRELGRWLARYPAAIHGSRGGPWRASPSCACTQQGDVAHLVVFAGSWREIILASPPLPILAADCDGVPITLTRLADGRLRLGPGAAAQPGPAVLRLRAESPLPLCDLPEPEVT